MTQDFDSMLKALLDAKDAEIAFLRQQNGDLLRRLTEVSSPGGNARIAAAIQAMQERKPEPPPVNRPPKSFNPQILASRRKDYVRDHELPPATAAGVASMSAETIERSFDVAKAGA